MFTRVHIHICTHVNIHTLSHYEHIIVSQWKTCGYKDYSLFRASVAVSRIY